LVADVFRAESGDRPELGREAVIPKINVTTPAFAYANYQSKTTRIIPIFELEKDEP
jgi:hypothetical protein